METNKNPQNARKYCPTIKKTKFFCAKLTKASLDTSTMGDYNETVFYYNYLWNHIIIREGE